MALKGAEVADNIISIAAIVLQLRDWNQNLHFKGKGHKRAKVQEFD